MCVCVCVGLGLYFNPKNVKTKCLCSALLITVFLVEFGCYFLTELPVPVLRVPSKNQRPLATRDRMIWRLFGNGPLKLGFQQSRGRSTDRWVDTKFGINSSQMVVVSNRFYWKRQLVRFSCISTGARFWQKQYHSSTYQAVCGNEGTLVFRTSSSPGPFGVKQLQAVCSMWFKFLKSCFARKPAG